MKIQYKSIKCQTAPKNKFVYCDGCYFRDSDCLDLDWLPCNFQHIYIKTKSDIFEL
jgi:hypothetical protein